jgi:hypothetical protein
MTVEVRATIREDYQVRDPGNLLVAAPKARMLGDRRLTQPERILLFGYARLERLGS